MVSGQGVKTPLEALKGLATLFSDRLLGILRHLIAARLMPLPESAPRQTSNRGRATFYVLFLSLAAQVFSALLVCALAQALAIPIAAWQCLLIVPPALLIGSFPFSLGGWGVREGALAAGSLWQERVAPAGSLRR
jgi:hypothetical protein